MTFNIPDEDAVRRNLWLRMAIIGPSEKSGKTLGALTIATNLMGGELPVIGVDSERERMLIYAPGSKEAVAEGYDGPTFGFKHVPFVGDHTPERWIEVIDAIEAKYPGGVAIFDSFSHEWMGTNGVLQLADRFGHWKDVRPRHMKVIDRLMMANLHVICCIRAKMKYEVSEEERQGQSGTRQVITKLGIGPIQDDAIIYEFDVVADVEARSHEATFSNRCGPLVDTVRMLDAEVAGILSTWLAEGDPPEPPPAAKAEEVEELRASLLSEGQINGKPITTELVEERFAAARVLNRGQIHPEYVAEQLANSKARLATRPAAEPTAQAAPVPEAAIPDGLPEDSWKVAQIDAWAAREEVVGYPTGEPKDKKLDAINAWLDQPIVDEPEDIPFGDEGETAEPPPEQEALV